MKLGINGFGRMGRLALRAGWDRPGVEFVAINEPHGTRESLATLLEFDSVQRRFGHPCYPTDSGIRIGDRPLPVYTESSPNRIPWRELGVEIVLECSGAFRSVETLQGHFDQGARRVVVSAPVPGGPPNIVVGVNHTAYDLQASPIVTAASCTTNCLAPIVRVLQDGLGIERGLVTTIHNPTNSQVVHDHPHKDPRRARASQLSLIPTSTNSATAVTWIIPELKGKLDAIAVRAPVLNASIVDFAFQASRKTSVAEVNGLLRVAAQEGPLKGILGYEERSLVSCDFAGDARSAIVDAGLTRVVDGSMVKVIAWYDNEWGYANRLMDLAAMVGKNLA